MPTTASCAPCMLVMGGCKGTSKPHSILARSTACGVQANSTTVGSAPSMHTCFACICNTRSWRMKAERCTLSNTSTDQIEHAPLSASSLFLNANQAKIFLMSSAPHSANGSNGIAKLHASDSARRRYDQSGSVFKIGTCQLRIQWQVGRGLCGEM